MIDKTGAIKLFEDKNIRVVWDDIEEKYFFSITDVISVLTNSNRARKYWSDLKKKIINEDGYTQLSDKIGQLKMKSSDGKMYLTDVADTELLLRIIQSIPSPKAEPFKLWLAKIGRERIDELDDPELTINRALETYYKKGYSETWINQRLKSIEIRKNLTDEWDKGGIQKGMEYAILTDEITKSWSGMTTKEYKKFKDLKKENLRDNMTNMELILNMLAEATVTEISKKEKPHGLKEHRIIAKSGGNIVKKTRKDIEKRSGSSIISSKNTKNLLK